ncbi:MAG: hypothetical protein VZS44_07130 [Bacilli bacterium]|nr:hypothetical protein [Bacilli bacterium]
MKNKNTIIGIAIFIVLILVIIGIKFLGSEEGSVLTSNLTTVYVATGGGKEDFLADKKVQKILEKKYKIDAVFDTWSNGKTITMPLIREAIGLGNSNIASKMQEGQNYTILSDGVSKYDALFTSDQRFYDYYKLAPNKEKDEADRYTVLDGGLTLNTPIVIYSWKEVVDVLIKENIVTEKEGIYYITDMNKLINYILEGKKWSDIGLSNLYGNVNIASTDPVSSSPGATYYGLLLSILSGGQVTDDNINNNLPKLKDFYIKSGYMNNTPADLFERYLKTGMGGEPMIVDYEKSMIDFANSSPDAFKQVKDQIRILYPTPTIWNSHCFTVFTDKGNKLYKALEDKEISQIAWEKYGFRTGVTGGTYDVSSIGLGVPQNITSTVTSLKMDTYNKLIDYLKGN